MNLQSWTNNVARKEKSGAEEGFFRQIPRGGLSSARRLMSVTVRALSVSVCLVWALVAVHGLPASAQTNYYNTNGIEYSIVGALPGDQMFPDVALSSTNGFVVWQDNVTDGDGWGISAQRLDTTLSGTSAPFRVNVTGAGDQERPRVAMLKNGGAVFVWEGGAEGSQHIFARFLTQTNTFLTSTDLLVSAFADPTSFHVDPAVTVLNNSNIVVVWSSFNQAGSGTLQDVYAKILSPNGTTVASEFLVNQFTSFNQRTPTVAALAGGGFVVSWVSEQQLAKAPIIATNSTYYTNYTANFFAVPSVNIFARLYQSTGVAVGSEFQVDSGYGPSANPRVASASDGSFLISWSGLDTVGTNSWDVYGRSFPATYATTGIAGSTVRINSYLFQNQYAPRLCSIGLDYLVVWTSMGQDGSREGVFGRFVHSDGSLVGPELPINTTTVGQQMQPAVASDGVSQFLAVWTGYSASPSSFDLYAQRYKNVAALLLPMSAPFVWVPFNFSNNVYQPQLVVTWAPVLGLSVSAYEVFVDGSSTPTATVATNVWTMTAANGLTTNSTHSFQVSYLTSSGSQSSPSAAASATTWSGQKWGVAPNAIPYEWMEEYYGPGPVGYDVNGNPIIVWPSANSVVGSGNATLLQVFLSGGNPLDPSTWLQQKMVSTSQGVFLTWNTQPGATYQVQVTTDLKTWSNLGSTRFAAGSNDSIYVGGSATGYYRVLLLR